MFTNYHLNRALVADRHQTLRHEARQHHLARLARRARPSRWTLHRAVLQAVVSSTIEAQPGLEAPTQLPLPPAAALAAWQQDNRAA